MNTEGWGLRSANGPDGQVVTFYERPKTGHAGVVERRYPNGSPDRISSAAGTCEVLRPGERPRYRASTAAFVSSSDKPKVYATRSAFRDLEECIRHSGSGRLETAGALFGTVFEGTLTVREATLAVTEQKTTSCLIDKPTVERQAERHRQYDDGMVLLGTWHTEPGAGDAKPSRADLKHWVSWTRAAEIPVFIGMTVRKPNTYHLGWRGVMTRAHVLTRTSSGIDCPVVVDLKERPWTL